MQWSLEDIYKKQVRGNIPSREHLRVLGEGTSEEHKISNRADIGYKDPKTGQWRFARASNAFIKDIMEPNWRYSDSSSYLKNVLDHGKKANVFETTDTIDSDRVKRMYNYLTKGLDRSLIKSIVGEFPKKDLQNDLVGELAGGNRFNFYQLINNKLGTNYKYDPSLVYMAPAGEEEKQRGAAGPGEALLAFLFNGQKPVIGDLQLDDNVGIELKKNGGRIGKDIESSKVIKMAKLFYNRQRAFANGGGRLREDLKEEERDRILKMNLSDFLREYSGVSKGMEEFSSWTVGDWFNSHEEKGISNYDSLIPLVGALQMKDYFNNPKDKFTYLAIFHQGGDMSGFTKEFVLGNGIQEIIDHLKGKGIYFKPNNDKNGYHLMLDE